MSFSYISSFPSDVSIPGKSSAFPTLPDRSTTRAGTPPTRLFRKRAIPSILMERRANASYKYLQESNTASEQRYKPSRPSYLPRKRDRTTLRNTLLLFFCIGGEIGVVAQVRQPTSAYSSSALSGPKKAMTGRVLRNAKGSRIDILSH